MNKALSHDIAEPLLQQLLSDKLTLDLSLLATAQTLVSEVTAKPQVNFAHMTADLAPYSLLGMQLATQHQGNLLSPNLYPALAKAEQDCLDWLKGLFKFNYAHFSHGGSYNNIEALWQARDLTQNKSRTVYGSAACHYSVFKACKLLGLAFQPLPVDEQDQLDIEALMHACKQQPPLAIVLNYGTTGTGAIDDITRASQIAQAYNAWIHIDAAWGGARLTLHEHQLPVSSSIDSLSFDPHKCWFQPRSCSVLFSRHQFEKETAGYLTEQPLRQLGGSYGGEIFLPLWLNWQQLGADWFESKTRFRLAQAEQFSQFIQSETQYSVDHHGTGIVSFHHAEMKLYEYVQQGVLSDYQTVHGQSRYRAVFTSHCMKASALIQTIQSVL
jgi:glutamate/tyrosine decarboxylase-like PLP-dependent enzyme